MDRPKEIEGQRVVEFWEYLGRQYAVIEWSLEDGFCYECLYYKYVGGWRRADGIHSSDAVYKLMRSRAEAAEAERDKALKDAPRFLLEMNNALTIRVNEAESEYDALKARVRELEQSQKESQSVVDAVFAEAEKQGVVIDRMALLDVVLSSSGIMHTTIDSSDAPEEGNAND